MFKKVRFYIVVMLIILAVVMTCVFYSDNDAYLEQSESKNVLTHFPELSGYKNVQEKKKAFFTALYPLVEFENKAIIKTRGNIIALQKVPEGRLTEKQKSWLLKVAKRYKIQGEEITPLFFKRLLLRVDYIPPSMVLAQAAIESGWGSSRFAKQGNNLFGQWCFKKGCGLVPLSRGKKQKHEVAKFKTVNASVKAYLLNLNTNKAYENLRDIRAEKRRKGDYPSGQLLAKSLYGYSEEKGVYTLKVISVIKKNKLIEFDIPVYNYLKSNKA